MMSPARPPEPASPVMTRLACSLPQAFSGCRATWFSKLVQQRAFSARALDVT